MMMGVSGIPLSWMRFMYVYNIVGAGVVGLIILLAPNFAAQHVFADTMIPSIAMSILGSIWLAVGVLSIFGLFYPLQFSLMFLIQLIYKSVWLLFIALPAFFAANERSIPLVMTILFIFWVVGLPLAIPFHYLFNLQSPQGVAR